MAFASVEDLTGSVELIVFPDTFAEHETALKSDLPVLVAGTLEIDGETQKIIAEKISVLDDAMNKVAKSS